MDDSAAGRFPTRALAWLLLVGALLCGAGIGRRDLWAPDEPKYALAAREMIETGEWLLPHVNGAPYPDKPPLLFWLIAAASRVTGGVGQPAAVIPSILAALLTLLATARICWGLGGGRRASLIAPGLLLVGYRFVSQATVGQIDMLLTACTSWAFLLLLEGAGLTRRRARSRGRLAAAFALMGLGILAKGPVALICPLGGFVVGLLLLRRRDLLRLLLDPLAWLCLVAVSGSWLLPAAIHALGGEQREWLMDLLFRQTVVRYAASWHHHQPPWYLFVVPWYDFLPTILLLPGAVYGLLRPRRERARRAPAEVMLSGACLFILLFFSIPSGKRGLYLMPAYPLLCAWLGFDLERRLHRLGGALYDLRAAAGLLGGALLTGAVLAPRGVATLAVRKGVELPLFPVIAALTVAGLASVLLALRPRGRTALPAAFAGWVLIHLLVLAVVQPRFDRLKSAAPFVRAIEARTVPCSGRGMIDFRAQYGFHAGPMINAQPNDPAALDTLAAKLSGEEPFWVISRRHLAQAVLSRIDEADRPATLVERGPGPTDMIALANRNARRESGWRCRPEAGDDGADPATSAEKE